MQSFVVLPGSPAFWNLVDSIYVLVLALHLKHLGCSQCVYCDLFSGVNFRSFVLELFAVSTVALCKFFL